MTSIGRLAAIVPTLGALAWMSAQAVNFAMAGSAVHDANREMNAWTAGKPPTSETIAHLRDDVAHAQGRAPRDPSLRELLGVLDARVGTPEYLREARVQLVAALERRPSSAYSWADLAEVDYRAGDTKGLFEKELVNAARLGPYEPEVQRTVANLGLAVWDEIEPGTRDAVDGMVAAGMRRNPLVILQIAERRGRLVIACRHLAGSSRQPDAKWSRICQSTEVTS